MKDYNLLKKQCLQLYQDELISLSKLSKRLGIDRETTTKWIKEANIPLKVKQSGKIGIDSLSFDIINTEEKAYWLGFIYADGYVSDDNNFEVSLKLSDKYHLERLKTFLKFEGFVKTDHFRSRLYFKDKILVNRLKELGCIPRKSLILTFPTESQVPREFIFHFIRGYFDGDGSIVDPNKYPISISILGTKEFLSVLFNFFGIDISMKIKNSKGSSVYTVSLCGSNARCFMNKIYNNCSIFLERKKFRFDRHLENVKRTRYVYTKRLSESSC